MGEIGENRRSLEEDIYWTHFKALHFTQFLRSGFDQHLALPKTFSDNIKLLLPENVSLKGPGGAFWNIGLTTTDNTLYFTQGWHQFVKDNSLKENDLLVFKYDRRSLFEVLIFDGESLCEKAAPYFVRKCGNANAEQNVSGCSDKKDTENYVEEVNTPSNGGVERVSPEKSVDPNSTDVPLAVPLPSETPNEKNFNSGVESASAEQFMADAVADAVTVTEPSAVPSQTTGKRIRTPVYSVTPVENKRRGRPPASLNSFNWVTAEPTSSVKSGTYELYTSNRRPVTEHEIHNALQLAQAACTNECMYVVMRPSHVYKRFYVSFPNKWILNLISPSSQDVILRNGKGEWLAKYSYTVIRHNGGITGGWKYFALDNNLEEFDVCVFKPNENTNNTLILDVSIFRVVEEITPLTAVNSKAKRSRKKSRDTTIQAELDFIEGA